MKPSAEVKNIFQLRKSRKNTIGRDLVALVSFLILKESSMEVPRPGFGLLESTQLPWIGI